MDDRINDVNLTAANGTCMWLLEHDVCANWSAQDRALLWIKGKPGSGKSTLLRHFLSAIKRFQPNALVLSFFFHGRGVELQKTSLGLFRSLLHQLLSQKPDARSDLVATFRHKCQTVGEAGTGWQWHLRELQEAFRAALSKALERQSVWVFIDALDECGKQSAIDLVKHFKSLLGDVPAQSSQFLIAFTCRHYPILNLDSTYEITLEDENTGDISAFVHGQLSALYSSAESDIPTLITTYARGVFMWASLLVDKILQLDREGYGLTKIEAEIRSTPPDLNSMYLGLVRDMAERPTSLKLFQWICFATRPLSLDELRWALITDTHHKSPIKSLKQVQGLQDYIHDGERMERRLKTISCGLVETVPSSNSRVVQFIHQSVRDFFVEEGLAVLDDSLDASKSDANSTIGTAHYQISRTCIRYIAMEEIAVSAPEREALISQFPLLHYAVSSWISHAKESESKGIPQDDLLTYFDWPSAVLLQVWLRCFGRICHFSEGLRLEMTDMQHILSQHHLISPLRVILRRADQMNIDINARDSTGRTPLMWAALNGDKDVIAMLLNQKDVQVNVADDSGWPALMCAGVNGHEDAVKLLLATNKVDTNLKSVSGRTTLSWAAEKGHDAVVNLLLAAPGIDTDLEDVEGRTPLWYAATNGQLRIVELLVEAGADIPAASPNTEPPLLSALRYGHADVAKLLIDKGACMELTAKNGCTPLHAASLGGHANLVRPLLGRGASLATDNNGMSLLHSACFQGHIEVVQLLLENGFDVEGSSSYAKTPLYLACQSGHMKIAQVLLENGANIEAPDEFLETPLNLACRMGRVEVVQLLLKNAANIETPDDEGWTPLYSACYNGYVNVARLLLENGARIEAKDRSGKSPLYAACGESSTRVLQLLLDNGANIESSDNFDMTPLHFVCAEGYIETVQLLIEAGANTESTDSHGGTPLHLACEHGHVKIAQLLLVNGANIESTNKQGRTPLQSACHYDWVEVARFLLENGANIEATDIDESTPLHIACEQGNMTLIKLLFQKGATIVRDHDNGMITASFYGYCDIVQLLLEKGVDVNIRDENYDTALQAAIRGDEYETAKLLMDRGAIIEDGEYGNLLVTASYRGHSRVIQLLLDDGADVNAESDDHDTALRAASYEGNYEVVQLLLANGADVNAKSDKYGTALQTASSEGHDEVVRLLLDNGADDTI